MLNVEQHYNKTQDPYFSRGRSLVEMCRYWPEHRSNETYSFYNFFYSIVETLCCIYIHTHTHAHICTHIKAEVLYIYIYIYINNTLAFNWFEWMCTKDLQIRSVHSVWNIFASLYLEGSLFDCYYTKPFAWWVECSPMVWETEFNPRSSHTKDSKNGTWYRLA